MRYYENKINVGAIKRLRLMLAMTQVEFAEALGVSIGAVNSWEVGRRDPIISNIKKMIKIAHENKISFSMKDLII